MLPFLLDENLNGRIYRGLLRLKPDLDAVRVQDVGLSSVDDRKILDWAADQHRVLVSHDVNTLAGFAYEKVASGFPMAGLILVPRQLPIGIAIEELLLLAECFQVIEVSGKVLFLPI